MKKVWTRKNKVLFIFLFLGTMLICPIVASAQTNTSTTPVSTPAATTKKPFITLDPILKLQVKIPGLDKLASDTPAVCTTEGDRTSCSLPWISIYIKAIYNYAMGIVGILAALALMIGGVIYLTSTGNATRISEAKSWITGALTGMLIMFTSYVLLNEVNPDLVGFKSIKLSVVEDTFNLPEEAQIEGPTSISSSHGVPLFRQCSEEGKKIVYNEKNKICPSNGGKDEKKYGTQANPVSPYNGNPNLCTSGCGVLSTFMAVNKFTSVTDLQAFTRQAEQQGARVCGSGSAGTGLIKLAKYYNLQAGDTGGVEGIKQKLDEGCVVVIAVSAANKPNCKFTGGGHFIALTGWREKDNLIADVNDPAGGSGYPYKGGCTATNIECKTWISLNDWGGCGLSQHFYVCGE